MSVRKKCEAWLRSFRSFILPSHWATVSRMRAKAVPLPKDKPLCIMDFRSIRIDSVGGRYLYHLVTEFEAAGFHVAYTRRFRFLATFRQKTYKRLLFDHMFSLINPKEFEGACAVLVTDSAVDRPFKAEKTIRIDYRHQFPKPGSTDQVAFPFFVYPKIQESGQMNSLPKTTDEKRRMRVFFAGNTKTPKYDAPILAETYKVLSRVKMIRCAINALPKEQVYQPTEFEHLLPAKSRSLTIAHSQTCEIPSQYWLESLRQSDFFLACPGVGMPLCHNLIEALAVGSIPILQHPQYLEPALNDQVNCLTFNDETSLTAVIENALKMPQAEIDALRVGALEYYEKFLKPGKFARQLMESPSQEIRLFLNSYRVPRLP